MTATIQHIARGHAIELISNTTAPKLSDVEVEVFARFVKASLEIWIGSIGEELLCMWGLIPPTLLSDQAYLWLHTTEAVKDHEFMLVRRSQIELAKMLLRFPLIVGHCEVGERQSIRWLRWLGAIFGEPGEKLIQFTIRGPNG